MVKVINKLTHIPLTLTLSRKGRGDVMVRQAHHDIAVTLSLRRELSRTLVEGYLPSLDERG